MTTALSITLVPHPSDDPDFVRLLESVLAAELARPPRVLYLIRIDNWFSERWLHFSGKVLGAVRICNERLTIPPFHPHRILSEHAWTDESGQLNPAALAPLHVQQQSSQNLYRFFDRLGDSVLAIWFSSNSLSSRRSSIMLYRTDVTAEAPIAWYASFVREERWKVNKAVGISPQELIPTHFAP